MEDVNDIESQIQMILENSSKYERKQHLLRLLPKKYVDILLKDVEVTEEFYHNKINKNEKIYLNLAYEDAVMNIMEKYWEDNN